MGKLKLNVKWRENVTNESAFIQFTLHLKQEVDLLLELLEQGNHDGMFGMSGTDLGFVSGHEVMSALTAEKL